LEEFSENKVFSFELKEVFKKRVEPFPSLIAIKDDHQVKFEDSKYFLSLYTIKKQST